MTETEIQAEHERFYTWFKNSGHYPHITRLMESGVDPDDPDTRRSASSSAWTASSTASPSAWAVSYRLTVSFSADLRLRSPDA